MCRTEQGTVAAVPVLAEAVGRNRACLDVCLSIAVLEPSEDVSMW